MTGSTVSIRLRAYRGEQHDTTECFNGLRDEAADLIDSLIAERDRLRGLLREWDSLIKYQYSGSREAMSAMTEVAQKTLAALKEGS